MWPDGPILESRDEKGSQEGGDEVPDLDKIFKAYDVRGVVPDELDESVAEAVGAAFVRLTGASSLVILHDMRTSSDPLAEALGRGAASQGASVIRGGLGSTDMV